MKAAVWFIAIFAFFASVWGIEKSLKRLKGRIAFLQGIHASRTHQLEQSLALYQKAIQYDPEQYIHYYNRSISYEKLGMLLQAEKDLKTVLSLNPLMTSALYDLGALQIRQGRYREAVPSLEKALALNSTYAFNIRVLLSQAFLKLGEIPRAEEMARALVEMRDDSYLAHFLLGNSYHLSQNYAAAGKHYFRAIHLNPHYPDAYKNLGLVLIQDNREAEAVTILENGVAKWVDHPELWYYLGCAYAESRRNRDAVRSVRKAIDLEPGLRERARQEPCLRRFRVRW